MLNPTIKRRRKKCASKASCYLSMLSCALIRKLVLFLHLVSWLLLSGQAMAACLNGNPSPEQEFQDSYLVLIGHVIAQEVTPESKQYMEGITYSIQVTEVLRGEPEDVIYLFSENSSGRFPMELGKSYLLFIHEELGRLQVSNCGNSGELQKGLLNFQAL